MSSFGRSGRRRTEHISHLTRAARWKGPFKQIRKNAATAVELLRPNAATQLSSGDDQLFVALLYRKAVNAIRSNPIPRSGRIFPKPKKESCVIDKEFLKDDTMGSCHVIVKQVSVGTMDANKISKRDHQLLENYCGFVLGVKPSGIAMISNTEDELELLAGDGMGGCFFKWLTSEQDGEAPIVYLSQYGETSRFANSLKGAIAVVVAYPSYWTEVLTAAHKSEELLDRVIERNEADIEEDEPDAVAARAKLSTSLPLGDVDTRAEILSAVQNKDAFRPFLDKGDGTRSKSCSFGDRPYPK